MDVYLPTRIGGYLDTYTYIYMWTYFMDTFIAYALIETFTPRSKVYLQMYNYACMCAYALHTRWVSISPGQPEITYLQDPVIVQQNIRGFQVPMQDPVFM